MVSSRVFCVVTGIVVCVLFFAAGCAGPTGEAARPEVVAPSAAGERDKPVVEPVVESEKQPPQEPAKEAVKLALKFTERDSTSYRVTTHGEKSVTFGGAMAEDPRLKGGTTGSKVEMTFTQEIEDVDEIGNAVAKITIKGVKYFSKVKDKTDIDFDSSREKDRDNALAKLIGQSYKIKIAPTGELLKVIDANEARAALKGESSAEKAALELLKLDAIKERHGLMLLPGAEKNQLRAGDNWRSEKKFSFRMLGSKMYEKIYTIKEIQDADGRRTMAAEMEGVPSSTAPEQGAEGDAASILSKMFADTGTYTGRLKLDLTAGKVEEYYEKLETEWAVVDPEAKEDDENPNALKMTAVRVYSLERID